MPTLAEMQRKIRSWNPIFPRCGRENEFLTHVLFFCNLPRAAWAIADLPIRVDHLPLSFTETIMELTEGLEEAHIATLCNMMWILWKARNKEIFQGIKTEPKGVLAQARSLQAQPPEMRIIQQNNAHRNTQSGYQGMAVLIDASWEVSKKAGWGIIFYSREGTLHSAKINSHMADEPLQAEAMALLDALQEIKGRQNNNIGRYTIFSDCKTLVQAMEQTEVEENIPCRKSTQTIAHCQRDYQYLRDMVEIRYKPREALKGPHALANVARRRGNQQEEVWGRERCRAEGIAESLDENHYIQSYTQYQKQKHKGAGEGSWIKDAAISFRVFSLKFFLVVFILCNFFTSL